MTDVQVTVGPEGGPGIEIGSDRRETDDDETVYLDGTLVLVGCGKTKRDPEDPTDLHVASVPPGESIRGGHNGPTGPAWRAEDLYTSTYFGVKREFAETVTQWTQSRDAAGWAVLSAEHGVVPHWKNLTPYDTSIDDLGDDPMNPDHRVRNSYRRRRPDGQEIVTEVDQWATTVAYSLCKWVASFRDLGADPWENDADTLLVLAGQDYLQPLRERGVFEYGIARMAGNPNEGYTFPLRTRYLFEEISAGGNGEQMGWLSNAIDTLDAALPEGDTGAQAEFGRWTGSHRVCETCGTTAAESAMVERDGVVYCDDCKPRGQCARCDAWTNETGLGSYHLCPDCQTQWGGQKREPLEAPPESKQTSLTDGGSS